MQSHRLVYKGARPSRKQCSDDARDAPPAPHPPPEPAHQRHSKLGPHDVELGAHAEHAMQAAAVGRGVVPRDGRGARIGRERAREDVQRGRLAGAVRACAARGVDQQLQ